MPRDGSCGSEIILISSTCLVIPGRNPLSILATIGVGIVGALIGAGWLITIILEVAIAALLVYFLTSRRRASSI
jgi:hypothetical protein